MIHREEAMRGSTSDSTVLVGRDAELPGSTSTDPCTLTEREEDVAALVSRGLTNKEVARDLFVSAKTVEYHLRGIYSKLGIASRIELRRLRCARQPPRTRPRRCRRAARSTLIDVQDRRRHVGGAVQDLPAALEDNAGVSTVGSGGRAADVG